MGHSTTAKSAMTTSETATRRPTHAVAIARCHTAVTGFEIATKAVTAARATTTRRRTLAVRLVSGMAVATGYSTIPKSVTVTSLAASNAKWLPAATHAS